MTFRADAVDDFLTIFHNSKDKIRHFPGCSHLELHRDLTNPNVFCTYSHWESQHHLNMYRDSDLFAKVWPATKALFAERPLAFSNVIEEVIQ